jgi:hypothetical protein
LIFLSVFFGAGCVGNSLPGEIICFLPAVIRAGVSCTGKVLFFAKTYFDITATPVWITLTYL